MSKQNFDSAPFDPFTFWKEFQNTGLANWSKMLNELVASPDFAKQLGESVGLYLESSAPVRQHIEKTMSLYLEQMNMPSRQEVTRIAERLTNLEMKVDDIDAKLDELIDLLKSQQSK